MSRRIVSRIGKAAVVAAFVGLQSGCQDLNSLVTGEEFLMAPDGSPRVEVEVDFVIREDVYGWLENIDRADLETAMEEITMSLADVGLRFYPVLSRTYERGDERPERRMIVDVTDLWIGVDEKTVEEEGHPPRVLARADGVSCSVTTRLEKRRTEGPPLVIGASEATGKVRLFESDGRMAGPQVYSLRTDAVGHEGLLLEQEDLLDAFEEGLVDALRDIVKAVDRDLEVEHSPY